MPPSLDSEVAEMLSLPTDETADELFLVKSTWPIAAAPTS